MNVTDGPIDTFCGCTSTFFTGFAVNDTVLQDFMINGAIFQDITFRNVSFDSVVFSGTEFVGCQFLGCTFTRTLFNATSFSGGVVFDSVSLQYSSMCPLSNSEAEVKNFMTLYKVELSGKMVENETFNAALFDAALNMSSEICDMEGRDEVDCDPRVDYRVYRDSFFVSASAFPGNIASGFAVYFFRRNYWLGELASEILHRVSTSFFSPLLSFRIVLWHCIILSPLHIKCRSFCSRGFVHLYSSHYPSLERHQSADS